MNSHESNSSTPFRDRDLNAFSPAPTDERPHAWFSTEPDGGDRLDGILRVFLVLSLLVSMVLCGLHLHGAVQARDEAFSAPTAEMSAARCPATQAPAVRVDLPRVAL